jgi:hypothetical protein
MPSTDDRLLRELIPNEVDQYLRGKNSTPKSCATCTLPRGACRGGVRRVHMISYARDGALLQELFTRDGSGTLITQDPYEEIRTAEIEDVAGMLELMRPLEEEGILVRRSRERLETEISQFCVIERDGMIVGCAALYPLQVDDKNPDSGRGNRLRGGARAMLRAGRLQDEDFAKPQIGIASTWSMVTPCNMHIDQLAAKPRPVHQRRGRQGVIFNTITISDGISMGTEGMKYSLVSREVIADSIETVSAARASTASSPSAAATRTCPAASWPWRA